MTRSLNAIDVTLSRAASTLSSVQPPRFDGGQRTLRIDRINFLRYLLDIRGRVYVRRLLRDAPDIGAIVNVDSCKHNVDYTNIIGCGRWFHIRVSPGRPEQRVVDGFGIVPG